MPAVTVVGADTSGHACFPPQKVIEYCATLYAEGQPISAQGHKVTPHGCPKVPPHGGSIAAGSPTVYVEGRQIGIIGSPVSCGSTVTKGVGTVFA